MSLTSASCCEPPRRAWLHLLNNQLGAQGCCYVTPRLFCSLGWTNPISSASPHGESPASNHAPASNHLGGHSLNSLQFIDIYLILVDQNWSQHPDVVQRVLSGGEQVTNHWRTWGGCGGYSFFGGHDDEDSHGRSANVDIHWGREMWLRIQLCQFKSRSWDLRAEKMFMQCDRPVKPYHILG